MRDSRRHRQQARTEGDGIIPRWERVPESVEEDLELGGEEFAEEELKELEALFEWCRVGG